MIAALKVHEEGHVKIAQCYAEELGATRLSATGGTVAEAEASMKAQIQARAIAAEAELKQRHEDYDGRTKAGRSQSALGGEDAILKCQHDAAKAPASP